MASSAATLAEKLSFDRRRHPLRELYRRYAASRPARSALGDPRLLVDEIEVAP